MTRRDCEIEHVPTRKAETLTIRSTLTVVVHGDSILSSCHHLDGVRAILNSLDLSFFLKIKGHSILLNESFPRAGKVTGICELGGNLS